MFVEGTIHKLWKTTQLWSQLCCKTNCSSRRYKMFPKGSYCTWLTKFFLQLSWQHLRTGGCNWIQASLPQFSSCQMCCITTSRISNQHFYIWRAPGTGKQQTCIWTHTLCFLSLPANRSQSLPHNQELIQAVLKLWRQLGVGFLSLSDAVVNCDVT